MSERPIPPATTSRDRRAPPGRRGGRMRWGAAALVAALACASATPPPSTASAAAAQAEEIERDLAEAGRLYAGGRLAEARDLLARVASRGDVPTAVRVRVLTDTGVIELEAGDAVAGERSLQEALRVDGSPPPGAATGDRYYPAKARFFLGEAARARFEALPLDTGSDVAGHVTDRLEEKSSRLLAAQRLYLEAIQEGNPPWGVAAGTRIGELYERLHREILAAPPPAGLDAREDRAYRAALRDRVRVLAAKATEAYEGTLDAARRHEVGGVFVERAEAGLARMQREVAEASGGS